MYFTNYTTTKTFIDYTNLTSNLKNEKNIQKYTIQFDKIYPKIKLSEKHKKHIKNVEKLIRQSYERLEPYLYLPTEDLYDKFFIPKKAGGLREINAPKHEFKQVLTETLYNFKHIACLEHNAAYAYVENRTILNALQQHQANQSNWFLKIDLKHFFPSCTPEILINQLLQLYPFACIDTKHKQLLTTICHLCSLNNALPQGSPISPYLTNLIMVPYDYKITKTLKNFKGNHYVYTRYADDILISSKTKFNWKEIVKVLSEILEPNFKINNEKTRFGSRAGRNWNLGLMLNKENNITLGNAEKKNISAMLNNFILNNANWSKEDCQILQGKLAYLKQIEPNYHTMLIQRYTTKYNNNPLNLLHNKLK